MPVPKSRATPGSNAATVRAAGWSGAMLAAVAVIGLVYAPSMRTIWIVILVLGAASVPQAWFALRRDARRERERDGD
jgi:Flp pilus assembly protein TadB